MKGDPGRYVDHMLEAIANIETDTAGCDFERFRKDRRIRQLVERNLEIISEASRRLPQTAKDADSDIAWRDIAGIGNVIRHDYHETYPTILWETCIKDLQPLKSALSRMRAAMARKGAGST
ncbi:MAG: HepT-like ribonuclease domain-containing protein [Acetobacteraceae bacterium]